MNAIPSLLEDDHNKGVPASPSDQSGSAPSPEGLGHTATVPNAAMVGVNTPLQMADVLEWRSKALEQAGCPIDAMVMALASKMLREADCWLCESCVSRLDADDDVPAQHCSGDCKSITDMRGYHTPDCAAIASAIEARSDATPQSGAAEGESATEGDAQ